MDVEDTPDAVDSARVLDARTVLRVERGQATEEELAAVAVTLFSVLAKRADRPAGDAGRSVARWRRWDRTPAYRAPHSWR
ncbi:acyl-CoA carboxylase subunit epsilon [Streptomyces sp. NPDC050856]|uniref:acyl-CoA carboxylase subunit epsilon n=1 Tax=Streptomyces sp. NPDC050856 TaxID=3154939 RepID=UPI0033FBF61E